MEGHIAHSFNLHSMVQEGPEGVLSGQSMDLLDPRFGRTPKLPGPGRLLALAAFDRPGSSLLPGPGGQHPDLGFSNDPVGNSFHFAVLLETTK